MTKEQTVREELLKLIPNTWLDPLLAGKNKVIGDYPYNEVDIEKLCKAIKNRISEYLNSKSEK